MKRAVILLSSFILLFGALLTPPSIVQVHASNGTVCLVNGPTATACPSSPSSLTGTIGRQQRIAVFIQGSNVINGFDITILTAHTILKPMGADLNGSILPGPQQVVLECAGGILLAGNVCSPTDTSDAFHFAVVACPGCISTATVGLLFTAIYNVTGPTSGIPVGFQAGCSNTSDSPTCVTITNGTPTGVSETVQTATFTTSITTDFVLTASPSTIPTNLGSSGNSTLIVTSVNNFSGVVSFTIGVSPAGLSVSLSSSSVTLAANQTLASTLSESTSTSTPAGTYTVTITGTCGSLVHFVSVTVIVNSPPQPAFAIIANPSFLSVVVGASDSSTISLTSLNGFAGAVGLTASISRLGPSFSFNPVNITLSSGGTGTSRMTATATSSTVIGTYSGLVIGRSGTGAFNTTSVSVAVSAPEGFTLSENPTSQSIPSASEKQTVITLTSVNGFSGNVNLVATSSSTAVVCWFTTLTNSATVFLPAGGSATQYPTCGAYSPAGAYIVTISGTSGLISHSVTLPITVMDYNITAQSVAFNAGSSATGTVTLTSLFGLSGRVSLAISPISGVLASCPASLALPSGGTVSGSCSFSLASAGLISSPFAGSLVAVITGNFVCNNCYYDGPDSRSVTFSVNVRDFSLSANPTTLSIDKGSQTNATTAFSALTLTGLNGFNGTISISTLITHTNQQHPPTATLSSNGLTLSSGGSATIILTVATGKNTSIGTYAVDLTFISGSAIHDIVVTVTVTH